MSKNKSGIWSFFSSVRLAIALLALIAFFAMIGTVVPQREAAVQLTGHMSPGLFSFLHRIQIFDLYHSIWFFLLLGLLAVNLLICSLDRFPLTWRRFRRRPSPQNEDIFKNIPEENVLQTTVEFLKAADIAAVLLKRRFRRFKRTDESKKSVFCAEKGRFSVFGVYIIHLSILVLITGAIIGAVFGLEGYVNINEGETVNTFNLSNGKSIPLPFEVHCDKFTVELYENGTPKTYQSDLTFLRDNQIIHSGGLRVNHPLTVEGFRFYQASFGTASEGTFHVPGLEEKYYTGLQINRDPGTPVVAAAALLLICGLMLVLFSYSRQVWVRIEQEEKKVRISIAGRSYKNKAGLERELQHLLAELKNNLENSQ